MITIEDIGAEVLVFGKYIGTLTNINYDRALIYCPAFDEDEPWLVTGIENVVLLESHTTLLS